MVLGLIAVGFETMREDGAGRGGAHGACCVLIVVGCCGRGRLAGCGTFFT
jgi:hypothetical protein